MQDAIPSVKSKKIIKFKIQIVTVNYLDFIKFFHIMENNRLN